MIIAGVGLRWLYHKLERMGEEEIVRQKNKIIFEERSRYFLEESNAQKEEQERKNKDTLFKERKKEQERSCGHYF